MQIVCYEDGRVDRLQPITHARPAYAITCASYRLVDWLRCLGGNVTVSVRQYLAEQQRLDQQLAPPDDSILEGDDILLVNARLVPRVELLSQLKTLCRNKAFGAVQCPHTGVVLLARIPASQFQRQEFPPGGSAKPQPAGEMASPFQAAKANSTAQLLRGSGEAIVQRLLQAAQQLPADTLDLDAGDLPTFDWPHDVVSWHMREMPAAMTHRLAEGKYKESAEGVYVAEGVSIGQYASVDTSEGPILLDKNVKVGPFCYLSGPVYAGPGTRVIEHAALKDGVSLGHTVKIGGEVEASVIEPYTNKQHHGFLGHSYLGSWINLGAGTCNSDLKNTYGKINIEYGGEKVSTGMQFLGCIMGDYSKTAINTSIFTGKVIGVCSMLYGFVTSNVPGFVNYARLFGQQSLLPADVMVNTQQRMFARRKVEQRPCDVQLIQDMYQLTSEEREYAEQYGL
ncbi:glucose-1-phosphate thymidylyltransferase [Roseiconus nitratireducens]|uniref:Glucose-1-phosphate thymidylyltransferase n=1 Tax=Roseiconus nitratireducens TaxID=2605748 RepID=A0A5M6D728_9BACT|nr:putative sugar nucleotidyl transferase [Roseiconus nitratireducens]KAA5542290.1 glucose-1-phosphate thymidylyltransferase [Roseiconus nitratireducens]